MAGLNMARFLNQEPLVNFSSQTAIGALANYISTPNFAFQPMNVNFGLFAALDNVMRKKERKQAYAHRSLAIIDEWMEKIMDDGQLVLSFYPTYKMSELIPI